LIKDELSRLNKTLIYGPVLWMMLHSDWLNCYIS
jgi:hypothetical protein